MRYSPARAYRSIVVVHSTCTPPFCELLYQYLGSLPPYSHLNNSQMLVYCKRSSQRRPIWATQRSLWIYLFALCVVRRERGQNLLSQCNILCSTQDIDIFIPTRSHIRIGGSRNFEAELRLPRQDWNALVNLPRQNFVTFSYKTSRLFSSNLVSKTDIDLPRQKNACGLVSIPRQNSDLCYTLEL